MKVELVAVTKGVGKYSELNSEEIIAAIARHGVIKEDNGKLVKYLINQKHWSPLDMINFTFEIETSRAIGRHILRHTSLKFQEHSQRYSDKVSFEPIELRKEHPINRQSSTEVFNPMVYYNDDTECIDANEAIRVYLRFADNLYKSLLKVGVAKECARFILPECTTTVMTVNGTLRSWLSFMNVRCDEHSQSEVREIANIIGETLENEMPNIFANIDWRNGMFL